MISTIWDKSFHGVPLIRDAFIETGTKAGDTLWEAKDRFPICHSIEINASAHAACVTRFRHYENVHIHLGDSRTILPRIIEPSKATTFYLDAHCEGWPSRAAASDTECPLLSEVRAIVAAAWIIEPLIIIDDVHMFSDEYWKDASSNRHLFTERDWPRHHQIEKILVGYRYLEDAENRVGIWG